MIGVLVSIVALVPRLSPAITLTVVFPSAKYRIFTVQRMLFFLFLECDACHCTSHTTIIYQGPGGTPLY